MKDGFIKAAAVSPDIRVADTEYNAGAIIASVRAAADAGARVIVTPELCVTGYTCGDLFGQDVLLRGAEAALREIKSASKSIDAIIAVGCPAVWNNKLYNCAFVISSGKILGAVPKTNLPNYNEFYERRNFTPAPEGVHTIRVAAEDVPFGTELLFRAIDMPELCIGIEICEDLWVASPPSARLAKLGATVILNLSASDETIGKDAYRRELLSSHSARLICGYVYADAGEGESTTDMVFAGHNLIAENGTILAEAAPFSGRDAISEIDVDFLCAERRRLSTFENESGGEEISFRLPSFATALTRSYAKTPFVPADRRDRAARCEEILAIQSAGLRKRLRHTNSKTAVVAISGGLDSCLALLVTVKAFDSLGLPRSGIITVTMPCFGTTARTKSNAMRLCEILGTTLREIDITTSVRRHFWDIGHHEDDHSVVYENSQARERTQVIMDIANAESGLVIGTGDLSELALGWATYNGDHMSMYGVNASVPKTLVRHVVGTVADESPDELATVLRDILDTPVSPELLPSDGIDISQKTEDLVGPYELHDFFLYHFLRRSEPPAKIFRLAKYAFGGDYDDETIKKWLRTFMRRFFNQQFKRSCLPDGPKVGSVSLSPRGDWRMPSDAVAALWRAEAENL